MARPAQFFVLWTAVVILFAVQGYTYDSMHGHTWQPFDYIRWSMEEWYTWAIISPLVLWLAEKYPIDPRRPNRSLPLHLAASLVFAFLAVSVESVVSHFFEPGRPPLSERFALFLSKHVAMNIVIYWSVTGFAQTLYFYRESSKREVRQSQLERQLAQAHLQVLQMQLHPHFLFNTLQAIGTLIYDDPASAETMLLNLSSLLRVFLEQEAGQQITLRRELYLVDLYLSIQKIRFRDRLTSVSRIDPTTFDCTVPTLLLQPIVENAILHGIAKHPGSDMIEITTSHQQEMLVITIANSNSNLSLADISNRETAGIGLSNIRQRLVQIYDGAAQFSIEQVAPMSVRCRITLPYERSAVPPVSEEELLSL